MENLTGDIKGKCNGLLRRCKVCEESFGGPDVLECPTCGAPREYCTNDPIIGSNRCKWHGGMAPKGIAHYNYQGKGLSRHLPTRMLDHYAATYEDGQILEMTEGIRLLEARKYELLERSEDLNSSTLWKKLNKAMEDFKDARRKAAASGRASDIQRVNDALYELDSIIADGFYDTVIWNEIRSIEEQLRKLRTAEIRRRKQASEIITEDQFRTMLGFIMNSIQTRVKDDDIKMLILGDLSQLEFK